VAERIFFDQLVNFLPSLSESDNLEAGGQEGRRAGVAGVAGVQELQESGGGRREAGAPVKI